MEVKLDQVDAEKKAAQEKVVAETKSELGSLNSAVLADLDNNKKTGTEVKREGKEERLRGKQDLIEDYKKETKQKILALSEGKNGKKGSLSRENALLINSFIDK